MNGKAAYALLLLIITSAVAGFAVYFAVSGEPVDAGILTASFVFGGGTFWVHVKSSDQTQT